jgi:hypothetical protein
VLDAHHIGSQADTPYRQVSAPVLCAQNGNERFIVAIFAHRPEVTRNIGAMFLFVLGAKRQKARIWLTN